MFEFEYETPVLRRIQDGCPGRHVADPEADYGEAMRDGSVLRYVCHDALEAVFGSLPRAFRLLATSYARYNAHKLLLLADTGTTPDGGRQDNHMVVWDCLSHHEDSAYELFEAVRVEVDRALAAGITEVWVSLEEVYEIQA